MEFGWDFTALVRVTETTSKGASPFTLAPAGEVPVCLGAALGAGLGAVADGGGAFLVCARIPPASKIAKKRKTRHLIFADELPISLVKVFCLWI